MNVVQIVNGTITIAPLTQQKILDLALVKSDKQNKEK